MPCVAGHEIRAEDKPSPIQFSGWRPIFQGIDQGTLTATTPRLMHGTALRVDLQNPELEFLSTPANGAKPGETDGLKTSTFLERHHLQAAINATPFSPIHAAEGRPQEVAGLLISRGDLVSPAELERPALLIMSKNRAIIARPPFDTQDVVTAVGGFGLVLENGKTVSGQTSLHARTAAGISQDGQYLLLLVIDGYQPDHSRGATVAETGAWLRRVDAWNGINLDGGGTSTMVIADAAGRPRLLSRPRQSGGVTAERVSGCHLGIRTARLRE